MSETSNPCISCGACCATFRVSFYWSEAEDGGGVVPVDATEPLNLFLRNMRGTNSRSPRCVALEGQIGECVSCGIYTQRPTPCREFSLSGENGIPNEACDRARAKYGLAPLFPPITPSVIESYVNPGATSMPEHVQSPGL